MVKQKKNKVNIFHFFLWIGVVVGFLGALLSNSSRYKILFLIFIFCYLVGMFISGKRVLLIILIFDTVIFFLSKYLFLRTLPVYLWGIIMCGFIIGFVCSDLFNDWFSWSVK